MYVDVYGSLMECVCTNDCSLIVSYSDESLVSDRRNVVARSHNVTTANYTCTVQSFADFWVNKIITTVVDGKSGNLKPFGEEWDAIDEWRVNGIRQWEIPRTFQKPSADFRNETVTVRGQKEEEGKRRL